MVGFGPRPKTIQAIVARHSDMFRSAEGIHLNLCGSSLIWKWRQFKYM